MVGEYYGDLSCFVGGLTPRAMNGGAKGSPQGVKHFKKDLFLQMPSQIAFVEVYIGNVAVAGCGISDLTIPHKYLPFPLLFGQK